MTTTAAAGDVDSRRVWWWADASLRQRYSMIVRDFDQLSLDVPTHIAASILSLANLIAVLMFASKTNLGISSILIAFHLVTALLIVVGVRLRLASLIMPNIFLKIFLSAFLLFALLSLLDNYLTTTLNWCIVWILMSVVWYTAEVHVMFSVLFRLHSTNYSNNNNINNSSHQCQMQNPPPNYDKVMEFDRQHRLSNQTAVAAAVSCGGGTSSARHGMNLDDEAGVEAAERISDEPPPPSYDEWLRLLQQKKFCRSIQLQQAANCELELPPSAAHKSVVKLMLAAAAAAAKTSRSTGIAQKRFDETIRLEETRVQIE